MKTPIARLLFSLLAAAGALWLPQAALAQGKIASVDFQRIYENYYKTKQTIAAINDEADDNFKERKSMIADYTKTENDYKALIDKVNDQAVSAEERGRSKQAAERKMSELRDLDASISRYSQTASEKLREKYEVKRKALVVEICGVIEARAKSSGYAMVIDSSAETIQRNPVFLFNNGENDITDAVLSQLNAGASTAAPKADEKPAAAKPGASKAAAPEDVKKK
jgi:outer membrane protein